MTEESKQRCEELASPYTSGQKLVFKAGYQAGMRDPDSNEELQKKYDSFEDAYANPDSYVNKLETENKKLREAMQFAVDHLSSMGEYSIVNGAIYSLSEALSSGGE